jgi:drug/metabolite transporter (DMT)-like permease
MMIAAVGAFSIMDALMKHLAASYPPLQIAALRGASSLPFVFATYAAAGKIGLLRIRRWRLHVLRAALSVLMLWGFVWALARSSLTDTYAVYMTAPLLVVLCASILLGEKTNPHIWLAIFVGLAGVLVMLAPSASGIASLAGLAALASALAYALVVVLVRVMAATETTASMVFWFLLLLAAGAGILAAPGWVPIAGRDWPWIACVGLAGWAGQHLITGAFRLAPAAAVAPYEYLALVWGAIIDWVVWRTLPGARMLTGAAIVVAAGLYLLHRERQPARPSSA